MVNATDVLNVTAGALFRLILSGIHSAPDTRKPSVASEDQLHGLIDVENDGVKAECNVQGPEPTNYLKLDEKDDA